MNLRFLFFWAGWALLVPQSGVFAAATASTPPPGPLQPASATNAPPATPAPPQPTAKSAPGAASLNGTNGTTLGGTPVTKAPATSGTGTPNPSAPKPALTLLDKFLDDLGDTLQLSAAEKKEIGSYYRADSPQLRKILNDSSLSPLQQAQQVSDLRDARNAKIESLLQSGDRTHEFLQVEARYRVALTELAAKGGLEAE